MKETILHYLWLHKSFNVTQLQTTKGENVQVLQSGQYLQTSGSDFFNAQVVIGNQKWAGNIEIHVKSSDWYLHQHERDENYDNVILHVVWEHDVEVYRKDNSEIPVLELRQFVASKTLLKIESLLTKKKWINCEDSVHLIQEISWLSWKESLYFEKLEEKSNLIFEVFNSLNSDWEATCFAMLAKNFGLNINGDIFYELIKNIPFSIVRKESFDYKNLEALLFGSANLLIEDFQEQYAKDLQKIWQYQKEKYKIKEQKHIRVQFYKLRPDNFPTIRLAQLAALYYHYQNVFEKLVLIKTLEDINVIFKIQISEYWRNHYNFDKESNKKLGVFSSNFIELLIINTIVPLQFCYSKYKGTEEKGEAVHFLQNIKPEKNTIIERFEDLQIKSENAFDSQALLYLKKKYCDNLQCLKCRIGVDLLQKMNTFEEIK